MKEIQDNPMFIEIDPDLAPAVQRLCGELLTSMAALESAFRQLHPPRIRAVGQALERFDARLAEAVANFSGLKFPDAMHLLTGRLQKAADLAGEAIQAIIRAPEIPSEMISVILKAMRRHNRAQELLYPLHPTLRPVGRYFLEPPLRNRPDDFAAKRTGRADTGLQTLPGFGKPGGEYRLYVPENYDGKTPLPLVVALHGGSGTGRDFIWTWLREARSRNFFLLAPTAAGRTWSFHDATDANLIRTAVFHLMDAFAVRRDKLLLTGFSDGAIYTFTAGMLPDSPFTALAPVSGVLHPQSLARAADRPIYLVHGALDWMFPVQHAHQARTLLQAAGADVVFREIPNLSHTYPREENARIVEWFEPERSLKECTGDQP